MTFDSPPPGCSGWLCPYCERETFTCFRCSHADCGKDLTKDVLEPVDGTKPSPTESDRSAAARSEVFG